MSDVYIPNILPFLFFLASFIANTKFVGRLACMSNVIIGLYGCSSFCHWVIADFFDSCKACSLEVFLIVFFSILSITLPLSFFEKRSQNCELSHINEKKLDIVEKIVCVFCFYAIIFFSQYLLQVFSYGIVEMRSLKSTLYESSIFSKCAVMGAFLSPVALFCFFYNVSKNLFSKFQNTLLLIGSLSFVFYTLNVAGRDGIVIWVLSFISLFMLFYRFFSKQQKKQIIRLGILGLCCFLPILLFISSSRFEKSDYGTTLSMMNYLGQGFDNLSYNIAVYKNTEANVGNFFGQFPIFAPFANFMGYQSDLATDTFGKMDIAFKYGFRANQFSFFIGSFYPMNYPITGYALFLLVCIMVYFLNLRIKNGVISVQNLLVAFIWYMVPIVGVFYFYYGSLIGNVFLLTPFLILLFLL